MNARIHRGRSWWRVALRPLRRGLATRLAAAIGMAFVAADATEGAGGRAAWRMKEPLLREYAVLPGDVEAGLEPGTTHRVEFGRSLMIQAASPAALASLAGRHGLRRTRDLEVAAAVFEAASPREALEVADALSPDPDAWVVSVSRRRFNAALQSDWAAAPGDPYWDRQWQLDPGQGTTGAGPVSSGMAFRGSWARTRGGGVVISMYDDGADATHPDLRDGFVPGLARNWFTMATNCAHSARAQFHGTATAGLAVARGGNGVGMVGAAPQARWAGQVIFDAAGNLPETEQLARAFGHAADQAWVQNHSWSNADLDFLYATPVEHVAMSNALHVARGGLGIPMVRSAGNTRTKSWFGARGVGDANLDAFANAPGAITVAGLRRDGTVASYSSPGACVLVAAAGGEVSEGSQLFSLDPVGDAGASTVAMGGLELSQYVYGSRMQAGTSFSAPQVTGLVALCLDVQPGLSVPDLQRLLAAASRPMDLLDPDLATNSAGLLISHNVGHGTPDPGLLLRWVASSRFERPSQRRTVVRVTRSPGLGIPDDGLRVSTAGLATEGSFPACGGAGLHPDGGLGPLPLIDGGSGATSMKAAGACVVLQRGALDYGDLVRIAGQMEAGAAVIVNSEAGNSRALMLGTDAARIPAVVVGRNDGNTLRAALASNPSLRVNLQMQSAEVRFVVTNALSVDGVRVRLRAMHPRMGDLRVTLRSPGGTWSVLQRCGTMTSAQKDEWWYSSRRHAFEASQGTWILAVTDEAPGATGRVAEAEIEVTGLPIVDADADGLDDAWEVARLGGMGELGAGDTDADGLPHSVEAWLGTSPTTSDRAFAVRVQRDAPGMLRLEWPVEPGRRYRMERAGFVGGPWTSLGTHAFSGWTGSWRVPMADGAGWLRAVTE
jgi:subtilisin family serine protease/subtilisin-like proprotein convertase family protein